MGWTWSPKASKRVGNYFIMGRSARAAVLDAIGRGAEEPSYGKWLLMCCPSTGLAGGQCYAGGQTQHPFGFQLCRQMLSWNTVTQPDGFIPPAELFLSPLPPPPAAQLSLLPPSALSGGRRQREHPSAHPRDASALSSDMTGDSVTPQPPHQLQGGDFSAN